MLRNEGKLLTFREKKFALVMYKFLEFLLPKKVSEIYKYEYFLNL